MIWGISLVLCLYLVLRLIWPLKISRKAKWISTGILSFISAKSIFLQIFGGSAFNPELPRMMLLISAWFTGFFILLFLELFLVDIFLIIHFTFTKFGGSFANFFKKFHLPVQNPIWAICLVSISCLVTTYGTYEGVRCPDVKEHQISDAPKELNGLKIVHLADIHISAFQRAEQIEAIVEKVNALEPDLILFSGDFVDGKLENRRDSALPLGKLKAKLGIFACTGNHDYYSEQHEEYKKFWQSLGIKMLINEHEVFLIQGTNLIIAGINDPVATRFGFAGPNPDLALNGTKNIDNKFIIMLAHQPRLTSLVAQTQANIQLSGHTHGGMVPILETITARANNGFVRGWYQVGNLKLHVSPGTHQWAGFLTRIGVPTEISLYTFKN